MPAESLLVAPLEQADENCSSGEQNQGGAEGELGVQSNTRVSEGVLAAATPRDTERAVESKDDGEADASQKHPYTNRADHDGVICVGGEPGHEGHKTGVGKRRSGEVDPLPQRSHPVETA